MPKSRSLTSGAAGLAGDEHVGGLEVAVDDEALVREGDALADGDGEAHAVGDGEPLAVCPDRDRLAAHHLHHEVGRAAAAPSSVTPPS